MQKKKAISLIVLVITIIVMIILASAIIMSLDNTNIFNKAEEAVDKTSDKEVESMASLAWAEGYMENLRGDDLKEYVKNQLEKQGLNIEDYIFKVTDKEVIIRNKERAWVYTKDESGKYTIVKRGEDTIEIGDYINNYTAIGTEYTGKWKVLGAGEEGTLLIISEEVTEKLPLKGKEDLIEGITKMDNACSIYGNGYGAVKARNIRIDEINILTGYVPSEPTETKYYWTENTGFVDAVTGSATTLLTLNHSVFYYYDGKRLHEFTKPADISDESKRFICNLKSTDYSYKLSDKNIEEGSKIYNTIVAVGKNSLAQQYHVADIAIGNVEYCVRRVRISNIECGTLWSATGVSGSQIATSIRPVVELKYDIELTGSSKDGWNIVEN